MSVRRFPVLVLRDFAGYYTACWLEEPGSLAALAQSSEKAVDQLRDFLAWRLEQGADIPDEDFLDPQLLWISVSVRPEYRADDRIYPCGEPIRLRLPCVRGRRASGTWVGSVPTLNLRFEYYDEDSFKSLIQHYAEQCFKECEPRVISRFLPPPEAFLEEVRVKLPPPEKVTRGVPETEALSSVAEPLGIRTALSKSERCWEREREVSELQERLRAPESSILLLGEAGTGKSAVLHEAIRRVERVAREEGKKAGPRFWRTSASRLIAGMRYLGQWEERCQQVIQELSEIARREGLQQARRKLTWTEGAVRFLSEKGFDRRYGARPLQRTLDELVIAPLSEILINRPWLEDAEIRIDVAAGRLSFEVLESGPSPPTGPSSSAGAGA